MKNQMSRKKPTSSKEATAAPGFEGIFCDDPQGLETLPPEFRNLKPGDEVKVLILLKWADPVDPNCDLVNAALEIICPPKDNKDKRERCRNFITLIIRQIRMMPKTHRASSANKRKLLSLRTATLKTARLLRKLPLSLQHSLAFNDPALRRLLPVIDVDETTPAPHVPVKPYEKLCVDLHDLAKSIQGQGKSLADAHGAAYLLPNNSPHAFERLLLPIHSAIRSSIVSAAGKPARVCRNAGRKSLPGRRLRGASNHRGSVIGFAL